MASERITISSNKESWDADLNTMLEKIFETGIEVPNGPPASPYTDDADLPAASSNAGKIFSVNRAGVWELWFSTGTAWTQVA